MNQISEQPTFNSARKVAQLFEERPSSHSGGSGFGDFVPYSRERDHLGRLITSKKQGSAWSRNSNSRSLKYFPPEDPARATIDRVFKCTHITAHAQRPTDHNKKRIRSTSSKQFQTPAVGFYDTVDIADKMKYKKAREVVFSSIKHTPASKAPTQTSPRKPFFYYQEISTEPINAKETNKFPLNFNLPELQKYLQMRKLRVSLNENFEQSHLKFKELARKGLVLAKTIRNSIEFD